MSFKMSQNFIWTVNTICILLQVIYLETFFIYPSFYSKDMLSSLSSFGKVLKCWNNYIIYTVIWNCSFCIFLKLWCYWSWVLQCEFQMHFKSYFMKIYNYFTFLLLYMWQLTLLLIIAGLGAFLVFICNLLD